MGCGAAKATNTKEFNDNGNANKGKDKLFIKSADKKRIKSTVRPPTSVPKPVAFEIPVVEDKAEETNESLVKKHPPKRLQRLEEQQQQIASITVKDIEEKQQKAEERRLELLEEKVNKSRSFQPKPVEKGAEKEGADENAKPQDNIPLLND